MIPLRRWQKVLVIIILIAVVLGIIAAIVYFVAYSPTPKGVVVTNGYECAKIGSSILDEGGNAVDAAIAALFCEGVAMPQSMGLGGGFFMTIYSKKSGTVRSLNAREVAPAGATQDMFDADNLKSTKGGLSVAVPGELRGYWYAYKEFGGKVPWKTLVQPTIDLCKEGILVTEYLARTWNGTSAQLYKDPMLRETFIDPETNLTYAINKRTKRDRLIKTLEVIAEEGGDALHNGSLTRLLAKDIQDAGGIITEDDLRNYRPEWQDPIQINLPFNQVLYTTPLPGSGLILGFIMNILNSFLDYSQPKSTRNWQRIVESFKYGYGKRTELGDMNFLDIKELVSKLSSPDYADEIRKDIYDDRTFQRPSHYGANTTLVEDHGTAHISVLSADGDAVSVTSTINLYFGAGFMSPSTGIILNDEMDDFSSPNLISDFGMPPSVANYIKSGKRPLSSMCPSIIIDNNKNVRMVVGAAGGTKITTSTALAIINHLWFNMSIQEAVETSRLHHQLFPMLIQFEETYKEHNMDLVEELHKIGHAYQFSKSNGFAAVTAISQKNNDVTAAYDPRRPGRKTFVY